MKKQHVSNKVLVFLLVAFFLSKSAVSQLAPAFFAWNGVPDSANLASIPRFLSQTGFNPENTALFYPYRVAVPQYRDMAKMDHWIYLPAGESVIPTDSTTWAFPQGAVLMRNIYVDTIFGNPASRVNIEFQMQIKIDTGWGGLVYVYDGADAELVTPSFNALGYALKKFNLTLAGSGFEYYGMASPEVSLSTVTSTLFRTSRDCAGCHWNANANGFFTQQLNVGTQLHEMLAAGIISALPDLAAMRAAGMITAWYPLDHPTATPFQKIRSYISANCANCHIEEYHVTGKTTAYPYFSEVPEKQFIDSLWEVITPGHPFPDSSDLVARFIKGDMPMYGGVNQPDLTAIGMIWNWIDTMDGMPDSGPGPKVMSVGVNAAPQKGLSKTRFGALLDHHSLRFSMPVQTAEVVELFSLTGQEVPVLRLSPTEYAITGTLTPGLYVVRKGGGSITQVYSGF